MAVSKTVKKIKQKYLTHLYCSTTSNGASRGRWRSRCLWWRSGRRCSTSLCSTSWPAAATSGRGILFWRRWFWCSYRTAYGCYCPGCACFNFGRIYYRHYDKRLFDETQTMNYHYDIFFYIFKISIVNKNVFINHFDVVHNDLFLITCSECVSWLPREMAKKR